MKKLIIVLHFIFITSAIWSQTLVNREWETVSGQPVALEWTNSIKNAADQIIHVGNTFVFGEGANVLITKYNANGSILWQSNFNSGNENDDYGIGILEDSNGNIVVVGTTDNGTTDNNDVILLKYNNVGGLIWNRQFDSPYNLNDVGTNVVQDGNGNIYLCISSEGTSTDYDFGILKYDQNGTLIWSQRYDYNAFSEIPVGIEFDNNGDLFLTGASGSSTDNWDFTVVRYDIDGNFISEARSSVAGAGYDQPTAYKKDNLGNIYVTGSASSNGLNYDIKTIKLDNTYSIQWIKTFDLSGLEDAGTSLEIDANGDIIVGGYVSRQSGVKNMFMIKYDTDGNELWQHSQAGKVSTQDATIRDLSVDNSDGSIFFVAENVAPTGLTEGVLSKMKSNGSMDWQRKIASEYDEIPARVDVAGDGTVFVSGVKIGDGNQYGTSRYKPMEVNDSIVKDSTGASSYMANQLIVRFRREAIKTQAIDYGNNGKDVEYEQIQYFLQAAAMQELESALSPLCAVCNIRGMLASKVFKQLRTTKTTAISRMGETIPIPDFWTTLILHLPEGIDLEGAFNALKTLPNTVVYSELNGFPDLLADANDNQYGIQGSLHPVDMFDEGHINIEPAWELMPRAGEEHIRVGVYDSGIQWRHEDFGTDLSQFPTVESSTSKVKGGYDFGVNADFFSDSVTTSDNLNNGHGTQVAGIIGALRNNNYAIAGIAGGNQDINLDPEDRSRGVSLYAMKILEQDVDFFNDTISSYAMNYVYDAIVTGAILDNTLDYAFGFHIANHSWGLHPFLLDPTWYNLDTNITLIREATHFANRMKVAQIASRGNREGDAPLYPAVIDDDWITTVTATGIDGSFQNYQQNWQSSSGKNVDLGAPGVTELVKSVGLEIFDPPTYVSFSGTSASSPHVSGVAGLLMSYLNDSLPSYYNLAPEDVEQIMERSATDTDLLGYDSLTGWGRLNAGNAMSLANTAYSTVHHFGTSSGYPNTIEQTDLGTFTKYIKETTQTDDWTWIPYGSYTLKIQKIKATVYHFIAPGDTILAYWPRPSSSDVFEPTINDSLLPRQRLTIDYIDRDSCVMTGYIYNVIGGPLNVNTSLPAIDSSFVNPRLEYTVLSRDSTAPPINVGVTNLVLNKDKNVIIYPNPSNNSQTLVIDAAPNEPLILTLYDVQGRNMGIVHSGFTQGEKTSLQLNVADLNPGIYLYQIKIGDTFTTARFVKE